jgi:hypothetical protein
MKTPAGPWIGETDSPDKIPKTSEDPLTEEDDVDFNKIENKMFNRLSSTVK